MAEKESPTFDKFVPILLLATVVLAFAVGILWQKVKNLETQKANSGTAGTTANVAADAGAVNLEVSAIKTYAESIGLNTDEFNSCLDDGKMADRVEADLTQAGELGATGTPAFFINGILVSGAQPYQIFADVFDYELAGGDWTNPSEKVAYLVDGNPNNGEISVARKDVEVGNAPVEGQAGAKITMVEFSDFECPYCERFYSETLSKIRTNYIDTGKVKMAYKQLPLSFHPHAQKAAEASLCAFEQGKFWEMHDALFESAS